jgi:hypothetical protein
MYAITKVRQMTELADELSFDLTRYGAELAYRTIADTQRKARNADLTPEEQAAFDFLTKHYIFSLNCIGWYAAERVWQCLR